MYRHTQRAAMVDAAAWSQWWKMGVDGASRVVRKMATQNVTREDIPITHPPPILRAMSGHGDGLGPSRGLRKEW
jgi:hypothetical protein